MCLLSLISIAVVPRLSLRNALKRSQLELTLLNLREESFKSQDFRVQMCRRRTAKCIIVLLLKDLQTLIAPSYLSMTMATQPEFHLG